MPIYTTRLLVVPQYSTRLQLEPSYSYQHERFCSTLIVLPDGYRKRFIQGIEVRCGSFTDESSLTSSVRIASRSHSDAFNLEQSMIDDDFLARRRTGGESYSDVRRRLMAKSFYHRLIHPNLRDDTDIDENDSFEGFSTSFDNPLQIAAHL